MRKALAPVLFFVCLVRMVAAADLAPPQRLEIYYGNALFGYTTLRLQDGERLVYERHVRDPHQEVIEPSPESWARFRERLDRLAVWQWKPRYFNPQATDGTQWRVLLMYQDRTLEASGSNAYPLPSGASNHSPEESLHFRAFLDSLQDLTGREFR